MRTGSYITLHVLGGQFVRVYLLPLGQWDLPSPLMDIFSAGAVYNRLYSKLSTNQKQSYICKSAIYAH